MQFLDTWITVFSIFFHGHWGSLCYLPRCCKRDVVRGNLWSLQSSQGEHTSVAGSWPLTGQNLLWNNWDYWSHEPLEPYSTSWRFHVRRPVYIINTLYIYMICLIDMICLIVHPTKGMMIPINEPFWCRKSCRSTWIPHPPRRWETFFADEMEDPQFQDSRYKSARNGLYYENYIYMHSYVYIW